MTDQPGGLDCAELLQRLFLFIDNEMDEADCGRVRRHLEGCAPCREKYQVDCTVKTLVARSCCEQAPLSLHERVLGSIRDPYGRGTSGADLPWQAT